MQLQTFMTPHVPTCEWMDGKCLMGLKNVHLELKVYGTAASQRNNMAYTRDRSGEKKKMRLFF